MIFRQAILVTLLVITTCGALFAYDGSLTVENRTGYTILWVYVVPAGQGGQSGQGGWGPDRLGAEVLLDGESFRIPINNFPSNLADIRILDVDEDTYTFLRYNLDSRVLTLELAMLDKRR